VITTLATTVFLVTAGQQAPAKAVPAKPAPAKAAPAKKKPTGDAPEISRSIGEEGGVVLFWPRVIPRSERVPSKALAAHVQTRLRELVEKTLPGRPVDVRPEPERVCPRAGCKAMTVGALLHPRDGGCVVVALISGPGKGAQQLVPWGGQVRLKKRVIPFRDPPGSQMTVTDYANCEALMTGEELTEREEAVVTTLKAVAKVAGSSAKKR
jgi:hypothetical protein